MIYSDIPLDEFCKRYKLSKDSTYECAKCGGEFAFNIPIFMQGMVGLESGDHGCGKGYGGVLLKPYTKEAKEFWAAAKVFGCALAETLPKKKAKLRVVKRGGRPKPEGGGE